MGYQEGSNIGGTTSGYTADTGVQELQEYQEAGIFAERTDAGVQKWGLGVVGVRQADDEAGDVFTWGPFVFLASEDKVPLPPFRGRGKFVVRYFNADGTPSEEITVDIRIEVGG